jgi:undecaprenyl-diphosphatase
LIPALCFAALFLVLWGVTYALLPAVVRGVRSIAARLARWLRAQAPLAPWVSRVEARRSWLPLVLAFAAGTAVIFVAADAFTDIAKALKEQSPAVRHLDDGVWSWFRSRRTPASTAFFTGITEVGGVAGMTAIVLAVLALLLVQRRFRWAAYLALTAAGGSALNQLLKFHYVRQRPDLEAAVLGALGYSFPSGHAMTGTVVLGALAYLAARTAHTWRLKSAAFGGLATLALAIGISRLYLGVHWASDVAAGFAAGGLWVAATTTGYEVFRQYRLMRAAAASAAPSQ